MISCLIVVISLLPALVLASEVVHANDVVALHGRWVVVDEYDKFEQTPKHFYYASSMDDKNVFVIRDKERTTLFYDIANEMASINAFTDSFMERKRYCESSYGQCGSLIDVKGLIRFIMPDGSKLSACESKEDGEPICDIQGQTGISCVLGLSGDYWKYDRPCVKPPLSATTTSFNTDTFLNYIRNNGTLDIEISVYYLESFSDISKIDERYHVLEASISSDGLQAALDHCEKLKAQH